MAKKKRYEAADLVRMIVCVIGCFFYGRIALVGIILGAFIILTHNNSTRKIMKIVWRVIIVVALLVALINYLASINEGFMYWKEWAFAAIEQIFIDREITDYSFTHMVKDMYYLPDDIKTVLVGDGFYTNKVGNGYYGSTDVGFMRIMLYAGLPGLFLSYVTVIYCVYIAMRKADEKLTKRFLWFFLILWVVLECKGEAYHRILTLLYPLLIMLPNKKKHIRLS